jgi:peptide/nickel transport system permease protein
MVKYIIKRLLLAILILFGVSVILYFLIRLMPVDYFTSKFSSQLAAGGMTQEDLDHVLEIYGLNDNSFLGILKGYWSWLSNFLKGDMGTSFQYGEKVEDVIASRMGISFGISFVALILEVIIAIPLGIKCACNQYGKFDYIVTVLCMIGMAFPSFFLGNLLIKWFAVDLGWFDLGGLVSSNLSLDANWFTRFANMLWHLVLPIAVMVILDIGGLMRYTRTNTLEVLNADYIRTARAKGLPENRVIYKHVFRNTLIPLITTLSFTLPTLFGGAMITETVFDIPGIGQAAYNALKIGDIPLAMGYNMFIAILTVIGTLLADIMYAVVDPRVKLGA